MELLNYSPLEGRKFQFMGWVVGFSLCEAPTSIGYDFICTILMGLIEDSPQARPTSISMEVKRTGEICIGKDRCSGAQSLEVVKGLLAPVTLPDDSLFTGQHSHLRSTQAGFRLLV